VLAAPGSTGDERAGDRKVRIQVHPDQHRGPHVLRQPRKLNDAARDEDGWKVVD